MRIFSAFNLSFTLTLIAVSVRAGYARGQDSPSETAVSGQVVEIASASTMPSLPGMREPTSGETALVATMPIIESGAGSKKIATHQFWDRENRVLFAATGIAATGDFLVTRANLSAGGRELDPVARLFTEVHPHLPPTSRCKRQE